MAALSDDGARRTAAATPPTTAVFYPAANHHEGFGIGEHVCLGAHLARMELQELFGALARRMKSAEIAAPVERSASSFIGGIKHLPVQMEIEPKR